MMAHLADTLPQTRGRVQADAVLAPATWFRVGGAAEVLVRPATPTISPHSCARCRTRSR